MSPSVTPIPPAKDIAGRFLASMTDVVPSARIDLFSGLADEIERIVDRLAEHTTGAAVHGARMAGEVLTFEEEDAQPGFWCLVGKRPDGKNCPDCLALHGQEMSYGEFLDIKFTTRCDGNCRCGFIKGGGRLSAVEPLTEAEITAALEA